MNSSSRFALVDICEVIVDCEHKTAPTQTTGIPLIRTTDISNGRISFASANKVSEETCKEWSQRMEPKGGDIILAREAPVGEVGYVPDGQRVCLGQRTVLIRCKAKEVYPRYILYLFCSPAMRHKMASLAAGSVVPHLNMQDIRKMTLPELPNLEQQKAIGDILGSIDDKIELNQRMNMTLEAIGTAVFERWFVDFEFPNEEGKPYKSSGGEIAYNDDLANQLPTVWNADSAKELFRLEYGWHLPEWDRKEGKVPVFGSGGLVGFHDEYFVNGPGIVIGRAGKIGRESVYYSHIGFCPLETTFYVSVSNKKLIRYLYFFIKTLSMINTGSSVPNLSRSQIHNTQIPLPNTKTIEDFDKIVEPLFELMYRNNNQNETLSKIRDGLLPKLMSGKIRVPIKEENGENQCPK
jgi:type I restriction enzyme S subunit